MKLYLETDLAIRSAVHLALSDTPEDETALCRALGARSVLLAPVLRVLVRADIFSRSEEGRFSLRRAPSSLTLLDLCVAVQGPLRVCECLACAEVSCCPYSVDLQTCPLRGQFRDLQTLICARLSSCTVAALAEEYRCVR